MGPFAPGRYRLRLESERFLETELLVDVEEHQVARVAWDLGER